MTYIKPGNETNGYSLPIANQTTLGGVKIGPGLVTSADGTISTSYPSGAIPPVIDAYIISGRIMGMGPAKLNSRGFTLVIDINTVLEIVFLSGDVKRYTLPNGNFSITDDGCIRLNIYTGELITSKSSVEPYINEILLARFVIDKDGSLQDVGTNTSFVVGGYLMKYFYSKGKESIEIISPTNIQTKSLSVASASIVFVNGELWALDKYSDTGAISVIDPSTMSVLKSFKTADIHPNTTAYNETLDALIVPLYASKTPSNNLRIYHGMSSWRNLPNGTDVLLDNGNVDLIDLSEFEPCEGPQAVWGEDNDGQANIIYVLFDAGVRFRKLLLGKGSNNLGSGVFRTGVAADRFNGSYKVIGDWAQPNGGGRIQDGFYYRGAFYVAMDSGADSFYQKGVILYKMRFMNNGTIEKTKIHIPEFDSSGNETESFSSGATVENGRVWIVLGQTISLFDIV